MKIFAFSSYNICAVFSFSFNMIATYINFNITFNATVEPHVKCVYTITCTI